MTRAEVLEQYSVDKRGTIRTPGKFEGCALYVPHFWGVVLDGDGEELPDGHVRITVTDEDRAEFPELEGEASVQLYETANGFVYEATP